MYKPTAFREDDVEKLVSFIKANNFATLVSILDGVPCASHIPLVVRVEDGVVKLIGHLAKQNPQWQAFETSESLAIFGGAHAYISPTLIVMNAETFAQATDIDYFITNADTSIVTPVWIVNTYSQRNIGGTFLPTSQGMVRVERISSPR